MTRSKLPDDDALEQALRASRALEDAPEALIERAIGLWQPRAAAAPGALRRLVAALQFDSAGASPLAWGVRAAPGEVRQLLFALDGRDVDLRVAPAAEPQRWRVSGQVLGPDTAGTAELAVGGHAVRADWNDLAEFAFDAVPGGTCRLLLRTADWEAELPPIELAPPAA
jgi:hypothetical protein